VSKRTITASHTGKPPPVRGIGAFCLAAGGACCALPDVDAGGAATGCFAGA